MIGLRGLLAVGAVLLLFAVAPKASAQDAHIAVPLQKAEMFLTKLMAGNIGAAYDGIFAGSNIARSNPQMIAQLKKQTANLPSVYGPFLGFERVSSRKLGDSVVGVLYVLKQQRHPIAWEFYFYRVGDDWTLITIRFRDQMSLFAAPTP